MSGALLRIKRERSLVWAGAMLTRMEKPPSLAEFVEAEVKREPPELLDMRLRNSTRGLRSISMAEYRRAAAHQ